MTPWQCKCGGTLYLEIVQVRGPWRRLVDGQTGETVDTDLDRLKHGPTPKRVQCSTCGKSSPNPELPQKA